MFRVPGGQTLFSWQKSPLAGGSYAVDRGSENSLEWKILDESEL
jgi:hypothetical protein